jgi:hypothetical protein
MRPLEMVGKVDGEREVANRPLSAARFLQNRDRVFDAAYAYAIDGNLAAVWSCLNVRKIREGFWVFDFRF